MDDFDEGEYQAYHDWEPSVHELRIMRLDSIEDGWWVTREKLKMPISNMRTDHLSNTVDMLLRINMHHTKKYAELVAELARRPK